MTLEITLYVVAGIIGFLIYGGPFLKVILIAGAIVVGAAGTIAFLNRGPIALRWRFVRGLGTIAGTDNRLFLIWVATTIGLTGYALHNPGSGLIAQAVYETERNQGAVRMGDVWERYDNLASRHQFKTNRELGEKESAAQEPRSWVWMAMVPYFWLVAVAMFFPTVTDDVRRAFRRAWDGAWRHIGGQATITGFGSGLAMWLKRRMDRSTTPTTETAPSTPTPSARGPQSGQQDIGSHVFWSSLLANLLTEVPSFLHAAASRRP